MRDFIFGVSKITADMKLKMIAPQKKIYAQTRQHIKKQRYYFADNSPSIQSYCFSSGHVWMWELNHKKSWAPKNWCFFKKNYYFELWCWRRLLRVPWTARRSNQSILKEISLEYSLEGLMLKLKLQHLDVKNWFIGKDSDAEEDWRQGEKGMTEDEMVGWHHWLNGYEFK